MTINLQGVKIGEISVREHDGWVHYCAESGTTEPPLEMLKVNMKLINMDPGMLEAIQKLLVEHLTRVMGDGLSINTTPAHDN